MPYRPCSACTMWFQCSLAWVHSIVTADVPYSKSTERSMHAGAAPVLPGAPLKASASGGAGIPGDSPYSIKREPHLTPASPYIITVESSILQSSTAGKSTHLIVASLSLPFSFLTCAVRAGLINFPQQRAQPPSFRSLIG